MCKRGLRDSVEESSKEEAGKGDNRWRKEGGLRRSRSAAGGAGGDEVEGDGGILAFWSMIFLQALACLKLLLEYNNKVLLSPPSQQEQEVEARLHTKYILIDKNDYTAINAAQKVGLGSWPASQKSS